MKLQTPLLVKIAALLLVIVYLSCIHAFTDEEILNRAAVTSVSYMDGFKGKIFSWHKNASQFYDSPKIDDPSLKNMLQESIKNVLSKKGYIFIDNEPQSNFLVGYIAALESSLSSADIAAIYGINPGLPELSSDLDKYEKGTLIIHVFDARTKTLLWRGALQAEVQLKNKPDARKQRIDNVVSTLLHSFPHTPKH